ncbi:methyltransferase [Mycobacterium tuberculosis variant africanum]|nr:methyltransferase [Mycobacterium tuberculosis variant africanum]
MTCSRRDMSLSFGSAVGAYERGRPSYPPEAIDWLLPAAAAACSTWERAPAS